MSPKSFLKRCFQWHFSQTHKRLPLNVFLLRIKEGFCSGKTLLFFHSQGNHEKKYLRKFSGGFEWLRERSAKKLSHRGLKTPGYTVQPVTVSPLRKTSSETFVFFISPGAFFVLYVRLWECNLRGPPDQDEQRVVRTANINHVWCATCGIFITQESQTLKHMHAMSSAWQGWMGVGYGQLRLGSPCCPTTSCFPPPPTRIQQKFWQQQCFPSWKGKTYV